MDPVFDGLKIKLEEVIDSLPPDLVHYIPYVCQTGLPNTAFRQVDVGDKIRRELLALPDDDARANFMLNQFAHYEVFGELKRRMQDAYKDRCVYCTGLAGFMSLCAHSIKMCITCHELRKGCVVQDCIWDKKSIIAFTPT